MAATTATRGTRKETRERETAVVSLVVGNKIVLSSPKVHTDCLI